MRTVAVSGGWLLVALGAAGCGGGVDECSPACGPGFECYFGVCTPLLPDGGGDVGAEGETLPEGDDGGATDLADVPDTAEVGECPVGEVRCATGGSALETCVEVAPGVGAWRAESCEFGCGAEPAPHCLAWVISNIPDSGLLAAGETPATAWSLPAEEEIFVEFDTSDGRVSVLDADWNPLFDLRPAGTGLDVESGIHFTSLAQPAGAPDLGVFSFQQLVVPENVTFTVRGPRALVLLSEEDATIEGGVFAGCWANDVPPVGGGREGGLGPGAGGAGGTIGGPAGNRDGGGGGGGFGGSGGTGGGYTDLLKGRGGEVYGSEELVPLEAGSGGGSGGGSSPDGRRGGTGGGAVEIVSGGTLTVSGWVDARGCGGVSSYRANEGGGGGGSGGGVLLEAPRLRLLGAVTANGGGGAAGGQGAPDGSSDGDDGAPGSDEPAAGGTAATVFACGGGAGGAGAAPAGGDAAPCADATRYNAGGGGGGSGRIRLNGLERSVTGLVSPSIGSGAASEGPLELR